MSKSAETALGQSQPRVYSDSITKRRKALFANSIGHFTDFNCHTKDDLLDAFKPLDTNVPSPNGFNRYVILESEQSNQQQSMTDTGLAALDTTTETSPSQYVVHETPSKESPTQKLKTPNDTSSVKGGLPKLIRKSLMESNLKETGKRLTDTDISPYNTSEGQLSKLSKIRTALFPDNIVLPAKTFYPKVEEKVVKKSPINMDDTVTKRKRSLLMHGNRSKKSRFGFAGVRHNIKKPKRKSLKGNLKTAVKLMDDLIPNTNANKENATTKNTQNENVLKDAGSIKNMDDKLKDRYIIEVNKDSQIRKCANGEDDANKGRKFFKSSRNILVVVDKNLNVQAINNDIPQPSKNLSNVSDFNTDGEFDSSFSIDNIIKVLNDNDIPDNAPANVPNPLKRDHSNLLSPTSEMCDLTSGLAINSPKKARLDITKLLEKEENESNMTSNVHSLDDNKKYYSIFTNTHKTEFNKETAASKMNVHVKKKKFKSLPDNQMLLDAGQKKFGLTHCAECDYVYNVGDPDEEMQHLNNHNGVNVLKYAGWKHENVVNYHHDYKIIKIVPGDSKLWWKKVYEVLAFMNRDLGCYEMQLNTEKYHVYFYIIKKQIVGCLVAEPTTVAYKMLESQNIDICSQECYPVKCGISRIWVKKDFRRCKIATALVNCLRLSFMFGNTLEKHEIAFSSPTSDGKRFAMKYCNTPNFYIYM